jgi:hypothetical protein
MDKYEQIFADAKVDFQADDERKIVNRAIELAKEWNDTQFGESDEPRQSKRVRFRNFVKGKLKEEHQTFGFVGALAAAVVFQLVVQLIVRWIMRKFFPEQ